MKICGLTSVDDATVAVEAGAWALGMILWDQSPRACSLDEAAAISAAYRRQVQVCGVFVDATLDEVATAVDVAKLTMVQLHGDEGPVYCAEVARRTGAKVVKAARVGSRSDIQAMERYRTQFHLLDTRVEGKQGGTGETFDWGLTRLRMSRVPLIVSGGLSAGNVADVIEATHPFAVDVASGTEAAPGVKDPELVTAFVEAVHAADAVRDDAGNSEQEVSS
ncbi:MAG: phosphoribosylanthranilate isomerase [Solirubrobacterales bacterium]|nr:phosphoribosylanthranilate isomerase [Solirubrobacterales bacterium]